MDLELAKQFALGKAACSEMADAFLSTMEQAGYYAGLYCSTYYLDKYLSLKVDTLSGVPSMQVNARIKIHTASGSIM